MTKTRKVCVVCNTSRNIEFFKKENTYCIDCKVDRVKKVATPRFLEVCLTKKEREDWNRHYTSLRKKLFEPQPSERLLRLKEGAI
jgi:hypothetical protein